LPGLTDAQRSLVLAKAGGNFLSMVENVGYLKKTRLNFVDKDLAKALTPAGESKVKTWSDDRRRRVEQRFEELQEEVKHLLGWGSKLGFRFLREVVSDFAKNQGVELGGERLLQECVNPLAILGGDQNQLMREFRDRAFFDVARQYFADYGDAWEVGLNEALCGRLNAWLDATFEGDGEIRSDVADGLMVLDSSERRDVLSMALSAYANSDEETPKVEYQLLRARILLLQTDAVDNLWDRVREAGAEFVQVDWLAIPTTAIGPQARIDFMDHLITAGAFSAARRVAESLVVIRRTSHHEISSAENLQDVCVSLSRLGDIEVAEGNLSVARGLFAEGLEIARTLQVELSTPVSLNNVSLSLGRLGDIEVAEGNLSVARELFAEGLEIARTLQVELSTPASPCNFSVLLGRLGDIEVADSNLSVARGLFAEGLEIARMLQVQLGTPASLRDVLVSLQRLSIIEEAEGNLSVARGLFSECLEITRTLQVQLGTPESLRDVSVSLGRLGDIEVAEGNLSVARKLIAEGLEIARMLQVQLGTPASLRDVLVSLQRLSIIEEAEGNLAVARGLFSECLEIARTLQVQLGTPQSLRDLVVSYYKIASVSFGDEQIDWARKGLEVAKELASTFPDYPDQVFELMQQYCSDLEESTANVED
jgi:tetratricopeptide (TPR) repeat protein